MRVRLLAVGALTAFLLAGCSGGAEPPAMGPTAPSSTIDATGTAGPVPTGGSQASGEIDCSVFSRDQIATFAIWTQLFAQVRAVDGLATMQALGYSPDAMAEILDDLDQLKGTKGAVYGSPDDALVLFRTANDTYAAILKKGSGASDADFAPLNDLAPDAAAWIKAQATVTDALNQACPDAAAS